jgi:hypothetical protein
VVWRGLWRLEGLGVVFNILGPVHGGHGAREPWERSLACH